MYAWSSGHSGRSGRARGEHRPVGDVLVMKEPTLGQVGHCPQHLYLGSFVIGYRRFIGHTLSLAHFGGHR
jgi:hypothetical protein